MSPLLLLYYLFGWCLTPFAGLLLSRRLKKGKELRNRVSERRGIPGRVRPTGKLVWVHCASIGESKSVQPLIEMMLDQEPDLSVLITSGTVTSASLLERSLKNPRSFHQFPPLDCPLFNRRFLRHWQPDLALFVESEIWPNMIHEMGKQKVPSCLLNGRVSAKSFNTWNKLSGSARKLFSSFQALYAQSDIDAERLTHLAGKPSQSFGNLKYDLEMPQPDKIELAHLTNVIGNRPVWLAASTHEGEEEICADLHQQLKVQLPELLTIIMPRHPDRGQAIADMLSGKRLAIAKRSQAQTPTIDTDIWLADTLGEAALLFSLAPVTLMGGTITPIGGHNFLEPAVMGSATTSGPYIGNFLELAHGLSDRGGLTIGQNVTEIAVALQDLLSDSDKRQTQIDNAQAFAALGRGATGKVLADLTRQAPQVFAHCLSSENGAKIE